MKENDIKILYPNYNDCLVNVSNSILRYYGLKNYHSTSEVLDRYLDNSYKNIVLILYDGLGSKLLKNKLSEQSFLRKNKVHDMHSVFPATTTAATTSVMTGLTPYEHCWLGWDIYVKSVNKTVTMFWNVVKGTMKKISRESVCEKDFPYTTIMDSIENSKVARGYCVSPFAGINYDANDIEEMYEVISSLCESEERKFIYAYCVEPDFALHIYGDKNQQVDYLLDLINKKTEELCTKLEDTLIIVTADHGLITVKENYYLSDYPVLKQMLVRETSIEARAVNFFVKKDKLEDFKNEFNLLFSNDFILLSKQEVIDKKIFGKGVANPKFESCLGDYLAVATSDKAIFDTKAPHTLKQLHAGISEDEVTIPLIIVEKNSIN